MLAGLQSVTPLTAVSGLRPNRWWGAQGGAANNNRMMMIGWVRRLTYQYPDRLPLKCISQVGDYGDPVTKITYTRLSALREVNWDVKTQNLVA